MLLVYVGVYGANALTVHRTELALDLERLDSLFWYLCNSIV